MFSKTSPRQLLLALLLAGLIVALSTTIINLRLGPKISYYESPMGIIERSRNSSAEQEYLSLKRSSFMATTTGFFGLVVMIGCLGIIIAESRRKERELEEEYSI